tara:strand:+ start:1757 stop:2542 length:786 start_codon:yes stop_codon:yes gene_type:complete
MEKLAVISASGGMDSTCLLVKLLKEKYKVYAISFFYGQKHELELKRLKANITYLMIKGFPIHHEIIDISKITKNFYSALTAGDQEVPEGYYEEESMKQTVVPNRNAIFASLTYGYALSLAYKQKSPVKLALGVHSGDHAIYPDCRPEFYEKIFDAFVSGNWDGHLVEPYLPYIDGDKLSILKDAQQNCKDLKLDFDIVLSNTSTSYNPDENGNASGKSGSDIERILAFHELNYPDPVPYIGGWTKALEHALKVQQNYINTK